MSDLTPAAPASTTSTTAGQTARSRSPTLPSDLPTKSILSNGGQQPTSQPASQVGSTVSAAPVRSTISAVAPTTFSTTSSAAVPRSQVSQVKNESGLGVRATPSKDVLNPLNEMDWEELRRKHERLLASHGQRVDELNMKFDHFVQTIKSYLTVLHEQDVQKARERFETRMNYVRMQESEFEDTRKDGQHVLAEFERVFEMMNSFLQGASFSSPYGSQQ